MNRRCVILASQVNVGTLDQAFFPVGEKVVPAAGKLLVTLQNIPRILDVLDPTEKRAM